MFKQGDSLCLSRDISISIVKSLNNNPRLPVYSQSYLGQVPIVISVHVVLIHLLHQELAIDELAAIPHELCVVAKVTHLHADLVP